MIFWVFKMTIYNSINSMKRQINQIKILTPTNFPILTLTHLPRFHPLHLHCDPSSTNFSLFFFFFLQEFLLYIVFIYLPKGEKKKEKERKDGAKNSVICVRAGPWKIWARNFGVPIYRYGEFTRLYVVRG